MTTQPIRIGVSIGELMDKITILEIKMARMTDSQKLQNVARELAELVGVARTVPLGVAENAIVNDLREVNTSLWDIEDAIRECEYANDFSDRFIQIARSVYKHNDRRAQLKKSLNQLTNSDLVEEKSYSASSASR